jgi:hypothetical protein
MSKQNAIAKVGYDIVTFAGDGVALPLPDQHRRLLDLYLTGHPPTGPPVLLTVGEVALLLRCSISSLNKWRVFGRGPDFVKVGSRVRYRLADIAAWVKDETRSSTSAA